MKLFVASGMTPSLHTGVKLSRASMRTTLPLTLFSVLLATLLTACSTSVPSTPAVAGEPRPRAEKKEIVNAVWMDIDFQRELQSAVSCQDIGVLVTTRGFAAGEEISMTIGKKNGNKEHDTTLHGKVEADGKVHVRWPAMGCADHMPTRLLDPAPDRSAPEETDLLKGQEPGKKGAPQKKHPPIRHRAPVDDSWPTRIPSGPPTTR